MTIKETSLKLAAVSLIADEAKRVKDQLRQDLQIEMDGIGADRVKAELDGETIAYVSTSKPKFKWIIKSDRKFLDWVKTNHPSEIVESVRESSIEQLLSKFNHISEYGESIVIDPNGEPVDWLEGSISDPYLVTKFHSDGREKLKDAIIGKTIETSKLLELETPSEQDF